MTKDRQLEPSKLKAGAAENLMMATTTNGKASVSPEIVLKAKRRRFSLSEKRRICRLSKLLPPECKVRYCPENT